MVDFVIEKVYVILVYFTLLQVLVNADVGVLLAHTKANPAHNESVCIGFNPHFAEMPSTVDKAPVYTLFDLTPSVLCNSSDVPPGGLGKLWVVQRGNCTFSEKALLVQEGGGVGVLVISQGHRFTPSANQTSDYNEINITVALITEADYNTTQALGSEVLVQLYAPPPPLFDWSLVVIWVLAVGTVAIGAYWSGRLKYRHYRRAVLKDSGSPPPDDLEEYLTDPELSEDEDVLADIELTWPFVCVFVALICGMLVSLYFFFDYLVYVIIGLFGLAGSTALYGILKPLMLRLPCIGNCRLPGIHIPYFPSLKRPTEVRRFVLGLLCLSVGVVWIVFRNHPYAWILQDFLGVLFCIQMLKTLRLPNFKIVFVLLVLLFVYDVFFVFITPFFTKSGESIMEKVALGNEKSTESLPMVLKVPHLSQSAYSVCSSRSFSLLGFGDIMVPGLLLSYCHGFDLINGTRRIYYITTTIAYGMGMLLTFVALALMQRGQPALLYLVPCCLGSAMLVALCRGEFRAMWGGADKRKRKREDNRQTSRGKLKTQKRRPTGCDRATTETSSQDGNTDQMTDEGEGGGGDRSVIGVREGVGGSKTSIQGSESEASDTSNENQTLLVKR